MSGARLREKAIPVLAILFVIALRMIRPDQPIVENYVGRQIPTAMVARNLEDGSGFLRPRLSTEPSPNLFLVEPPIYAWIVAITRPLAPRHLEARGRIVSALATGLAAWGLYGLARRREGPRVALIAVLAFGLFPVMIRYGRAFQPDALMLGLLVAGMRFLDDFSEDRRAFRLVGFAISMSTGLAVKVISAYVMVPTLVCLVRPPRKWLSVLVVATLLPAVLWYIHAASLLGEGSRASVDNAEVWSRSLGVAALLRRETWTSSLWYLTVKSFTPMGFLLAVIGFLASPRLDRLWWVWLASTLAAFALLSGKIHHEYYWIALAPVVAVGVGRVVLLRSRVLVLVGLGLFAMMGLFQSRSTWKTPDEWKCLPLAAQSVGRFVNAGSTPSLIASEALLFASRSRGFRLEISPSARVRAAGEFGGTINPDDPLALVEFYRANGAKFVADLWPVGPDPERRLLHEAIRRRYNVRMDRDGVLIAELTDRTSR